MIQKNVPKSKTPEEIRAWFKNVQYLLDEPEVFTPEMNSQTKEWTDEDIKVGFISPVKYSASIANLGVAILYDIINNRVDGAIAERFYYPETKLKKRMDADRIPLFAKESFHQAKDFDILGISSYYPLQYLGFPDIFSMAGLNLFSKDREEADPIVVMGGVCAFNAAPVADYFDMIFMGDGEEQLDKVINIIKEEKAKDSTKVQTLMRCTKEVQGVYVPQFYEEEYYPTDHQTKPNQYKAHLVRPEFPDAPKRIKRHVADISKIQPIERMFVSNSEGQEMAVGGVEITRGCGNKCMFCEGSYRSQPYRERPLPMIKDAFLNLMKNTGAKVVTPYAFNLSDHSKINSIIDFLVRTYDKRITMSSQYVAKFDMNFASLVYATGNRSVTIAFESASQRMRDKIAKNLTEAQIMACFDTIFRVGFAKVKIYMIANLPGETDFDRMELVRVMKKIRDLQHEIQGDVMKTRIRMSWTAYNGKAHTPMQWARVYETDENDRPVMSRTLDPVIKGLRELDIPVRMSSDTEVGVINQIMSFGDRRIAKVIEEFASLPDWNYAGGLSIGNRKPLDQFAPLIAKHGFTYEFFLREKADDEVFAWDFIDMGVKRSFLKKAYFDNYINEKTIRQCVDECVTCGGCTTVARDHFKKYWEGTMEPDPTTALEYLATKKEKTTVQRFRVKINIKEDFRAVHQSKIKTFIRRAFIRLNAPIRENMALSSDRLKFSNWTAGIEYAEVLMDTKWFDTKDLCARLNATFDDIQPIEFLEVSEFSKDSTQFLEEFEFIMYSIKLPKSLPQSKNARKYIKEVLSSDKFDIKLKVMGESRDTTQTIIIDALPYIKDMWVKDHPKDIEIFALLKDRVGMYELLPQVLKTQKRNILVHPVFKHDYMLTKADGMQDMFAELCEVCGAEIEENVLGELVHPTRCARHMLE